MYIVQCTWQYKSISLSLIVNFPAGSASTVQFLPFKPHLLALSLSLSVCCAAPQKFWVSCKLHWMHKLERSLGIVKVMVCHSGGQKQAAAEDYWGLLFFTKSLLFRLWSWAIRSSLSQSKRRVRESSCISPGKPPCVTRMCSSSQALKPGP